MGLYSTVYAQETLSNRRDTTITLSADTLVLDSLSIVPESFVLTKQNGDTISTEDYTLIETESKFIASQKLYGQQVTLFFQVFPLNFSQEYKHKDIGLLQDNVIEAPRFYDAQRENSSEEFVPFDGLTKSGSISRAISVGNNQDVVLNSNLNLQLSGKLSDDITIKATITDNSIPVQSDGYTQQLREFDNVYIQLASESLGTLTGGDFNIGRRKSTFLSFDKRVFGVGYEGNFKKDSAGYTNIVANAALSRGKFARNTFRGLEGNQGPYKLVGNNNELFIIIISGSERVYIDGRLLKRGEDNDYIIDYNAGELTFTALQPITKDKRIVVEFQYTDQSFTRSIFYGGVEQKTGKLKYGIFAYSEQDAKNQEIQQNLSDNQKQLLSEIGDNLNQAISQSAQNTGFSENDVRYKRVVAPVPLPNGADSIFVFSTNPDSAVFQVTFSNVGQGNGNYRPSENFINGRVFDFVEPINGISQGTHEPIVQLVTPKQLQVFTFAGEYELGKKSSTGAEVALSNNDQNLFSDIDSEDDRGSAAKFFYNNYFKLKGDWLLKADVNYEFIQQNFTTIERFRNVEFLRDWNLGDTLGNTDQHLAQAGTNFTHPEKGNIGYKLQYLQNGSAYRGVRNYLSGKLNNNGLRAIFTASLLNSESDFNNSFFIRQKSEFSKTFTNKMVIGARGESESNEISSTNNNDSLFATSFSFNQWEYFIGYGDTTTTTQFELGYNTRTDFNAINGNLEPFTIADGVKLTGNYRNGAKTNLTASINYRDLEILTDTLRPIERTITSRIRLQQKALKNVVTFTTFYESGSGNEARREFSYLEVAPGQGTYTWIDYNDNGIQELDEFEIAQFTSDATYVRIFSPTNDFVRTNTNKFSQLVLINPFVVWSSKKGLKKTISKFSTQTTYQIDRKSLIDGNQNNLNPFSDVDDSLVITLNSSFRNTLFFNRTENVFGADYTYQQNNTKSFLSFGIETRKFFEHSVNLRWRFTESYTINLGTKLGETINLSENFGSRNFFVDSRSAIPSLSFQPASNFRLTVNFELTEKENRSELAEKLTSRRAGLEFNYNLASKSLVVLKLNYINNEFNANENTAVAYEMLNGLRNGNNATWSASIQRNIAKNLQLNIIYDGRISENNPAIHTGNIQIKAFF